MGDDRGALEQAASLLAAGIIQATGQGQTPAQAQHARRAAAYLTLRLLVAGWLDDRVAAAVRWNASTPADANASRVLLGLLDAALPTSAPAAGISAAGSIPSGYLSPALGLLAQTQQPLRPGIAAARAAAAWGERLLALTDAGPQPPVALGVRLTRQWLAVRPASDEGPVERWARLGAARVLDPACGAGAALIEAAAALIQALDEARAVTNAPAMGKVQAAQHVAAHCLFGADPRLMAVALAQLALVALSGEPDAATAHVQVGKPEPGFPWAATFPDAYPQDSAPEQRGFDMVLTEQPEALAHLRRMERRTYLP